MKSHTQRERREWRASEASEQTGKSIPSERSERGGPIQVLRARSASGPMVPVQASQMVKELFIAGPIHHLQQLTKKNIQFTKGKASQGGERKRLTQARART